MSAVANASDVDLFSTQCNNGIKHVKFPENDKLVTEYFEPPDPWKNVVAITSEQLLSEYLVACEKHGTAPIQSLVQQIKELTAADLSGTNRVALLNLSALELRPADADALESLLRRLRYERIDLSHAVMSDVTAECVFDMLEYYEAAVTIDITSCQNFGIRGWQACSRMIKKSCSLSELCCGGGDALNESEATILSRALRPQHISLRVLRLQHASLAGQPLQCLVSALKCNVSVREVYLSDNQLCPQDALELGALLQYNSHIQRLDLSNNKIQDAGIANLAKGLVSQSSEGRSTTTDDKEKTERGLAVLVLWNNQLTRNCANELTRILNHSKTLCVLNIGRNALGGEGVRGVCDADGQLVSLGLQAARVTLDGATALATLLTRTRTLQRLDLRDNKLCVKGLRLLAAAVKENRALTRVDLDDPPASDPNSLTLNPDAVEMTKLICEIRNTCRGNETVECADSELKQHRKISLTCHTTSSPYLAQPASNIRRSRLRSPSPSPATSPTPVLRTTAEAGCTPPSRFRVVQVLDAPQPTSSPPKSPVSKRSRFSVTRNYDDRYKTPTKIVITDCQNQTKKPDTDKKDDYISLDIKSESPMSKIEAITQDLGTLIEEMQELSVKTSLIKKNDDLMSLVPEKQLKKNKSESSLDSTDLEVSRLMRKDEKVFYDSSSSLDVSGSSVESLNQEPCTSDPCNKVTVKLVDLDELTRHAASNESSFDSESTYCQNSSLDSNESVSPNVFGKHIKLHGSLSSLETSMGSLDSARCTNQEQFLFGEQDVKELSSNEVTLTSSGNDIRQVSTETLKPKSERTRKISFVAASPANHQIQRQDSSKPEQAKLSTNLEKLLSLFHHPTSLFTRQNEEQARKDSQGGFWSWTLSGSENKDLTTVPEANSDTSPENESSDSTLSSEKPIKTDDGTEKASEASEIDHNSRTSDNLVTTDTVNQKVQNIDLSVDLKNYCDINEIRMGGDKEQTACGPVDACLFDRPRTFAAVLKETTADNCQTECNQLKTLPSQVLAEIKENISPENTLIDCVGQYVTMSDETKAILDGKVDIAKDALSYLNEESSEFDMDGKVVGGFCKSISQPDCMSLSEELKLAELSDRSPELVIEEPSIARTVESYIMSQTLEIKTIDKIKLVRSNSLEELSLKEPLDFPTESKKAKSTKSIAFAMPEASSSPKEIPKSKFDRSVSPKSLPENFGKLRLSDLPISRKKKKVNSLGKIARDSLLALNITEEEICEFRKSYKLTSVESLRSLESVSEDANSQSGNSADSRCRTCIRTSQESLMSMDSVTEECECDLKRKLVNR